MRKLLQHKSNLILLSILILAAFLRLHRISEYMVFLGDEGRDALAVYGILHGHLTLLGPRASAGDFFTGPIYYYMIAPFLWLFHFDPVGPAIFIALLGIATVFLIYWVGKRLFNEQAGIFAAGLYAVSPLVLTYSRSSWNPNPMPFFSLLILYLLYKAVKDPTWKQFVFTGFLFGITFQLHYIETFLAVTIFFFILFGNLLLQKTHHFEGAKQQKNLTEKKSTGTKGNSSLMLRMTGTTIIKEYVQFFFGFLVGFSPFIAFEIRHGFANTKTIFNFIFFPNLPANAVTHMTFIGSIWDVFFRLFGRLLVRFPEPLQLNQYSGLTLQFWGVIVLLLTIGSIVALLRVKNKLVVLLFFLWLFFGVVLFGFYKKNIYDYYFEFMFPLPFLLLGNFLSESYKAIHLGKIGKALSLGIFLLLVAFNLYANPFRRPGNHQRNQVKSISDFVLSKTNGKPFNFALIAQGNSDHAYRYYFAVEDRDPVTIENNVADPKRTTVTDQLLIVCEDPDCRPLGNPLWEIAGFGKAELAGEWKISVVRVYKLVHPKGE